MSKYDTVSCGNRGSSAPVPGQGFSEAVELSFGVAVGAVLLTGLDKGGDEE